MKFGRNSRRSIRSSLFIGVLAGSVFSGSGAFADIQISSKVDLLAIGVDPAKPLSEKYVLSESIVLDAPVGGATYIAGTFTGSIDGANNEISGLSKPLFDKVSGEVKNLTLVTDVETLGVSGRLA